MWIAIAVATTLIAIAVLMVFVAGGNDGEK